jgi:hypothetical protein
MITIDSTLDEIMKLDFASREVLLEVFQKRQADARRDEIAKTAKSSIKHYKAGKSKPLSADDVVAHLNSL